MKKLLLSLLIILSTVSAYAYDFEVDGIYYNITDVINKFCSVTYKKYNSYTGEVIIPSSVQYNNQTYLVASIEERAFNGCSSMTSITIPSSVTSIGNRAFSWCSGLTSISIPNSVTSIDDYTFYKCSSLTAVTIPSSVTSIGNRAFSCCSGLTSVTIPNSIITIGGSAFDNCNNLSSFYGNFASEDHRCLIVDGVLNSFAPANLTSYTIPNSVTSIGENAFIRCSSLTSVTIPESVTSISSWAFPFCSNLSIFNGKFASEDHRCLIADGILISFAPADLSSYTIPNSISSIGENAFLGCSNLTSVTIPESVTYIGSSAFSECSSLTSISIPNSVTSIGDRTFSYCSSLTSITIPNSVTSIGDETFINCSGLTSVTIPNSVTSINSGTFVGCSGLTSVTIPNSVTSIDTGAFQGCSGLTHITIPSSVNSIGESALHSCSSLTSVTIPNSVKYIGSSAFVYCSSLTSVTIPNSITSISSSTFDGCSSLTSVTIPNTVTSIGMQAFQGCSSLTSITIPNTVTSIGNSVFSGCSRLTYITIPSSVTSIGLWAFYGCKNLLSIYNYSTVPQAIGEDIFYNCNSRLRMYVPKGTLETYRNANGWSDYKSQIQELRYDFEIDGIYYAVVSEEDKTCEISYKSDKVEEKEYRYKGDIFIPSDVEYCSNHYNVIGIGGGAFSYSPELTSVTISEGIEYIRNKQTAGSPNLKKIIIPSTCINIENGAFVDNSLSQFVVSEDNPAYADSDNMLCDKNKKCIITYPSCLSNEVIIPDYISSVNDYAFGLNENLEILTIGENVTEIGSGAFELCPKLYNITFNTKLEIIGNSAFNNCNNLTKISIPESVKTIGEDAFRYCENLETVTICDGVSSIGNFAFANCTNLYFINNYSTVPQATGKNIFDNCNSRLIVYVPKGTLETYRGADGWSDYKSQIKEIPYDFEADGIYYAVLSEEDKTCKVVAWGTYTGDIVIPNSISVASKSYSVTMIDEGAFSGSDISNIALPNSLKVIDDGAFTGCKNLISIEIPEGVITIRNEVFTKCINLESVVLPITLEEIGTFTFGACMSLSNINLPNNLTTIKAGLFAECSSLENIVIPEGVETIETNAFVLCSSLSNITLPSSIRVIIDKTFVGCNSLTTLNIPFGVTTIEYAAFGDCESLTSVTLPSSMQILDGYVFKNCNNLSEVKNYSKVPQTALKDNFANCSPNLQIFVHKSSLETYKTADGWSEYKDLFAPQPYYDLSITDQSGLATLWLDFNAEIPDGVEAYYAESVENKIVGNEESNVLRMRKIDGKVLPRETGVVVKKTDSATTYCFDETDKSGSEIESLFVGSATETTFGGDGYNYYKLTYADATHDLKTFGFYLGNTDGSITAKPNRAYLKLPATSESKIRAIGMSFGDSTTDLGSAIIGGDYGNINSDNSQMYDLQGKPVGSEHQGIVVKQGKKFMLNNRF